MGGEVEIFELYDHPETDKLYAWVHEIDDIDNPERHVYGLKYPPYYLTAIGCKGSNHSRTQEP